MKTLISNIFSELSYPISQGDFQYYTNEKAFYFYLEISEDILKPLKSMHDLERNEAYTSFMTNFRKLVVEANQPTIEKNSSLIICVKCNSLSVLFNLNQQILILEEDEYFLKKYVVLFTDQTAESLNRPDLIVHLNHEIQNIENFKKFASFGYSDDIAEYILILQLFIKLPILSLTFERSDFVSLDQKIVNSLGTLGEINSHIKDEYNLISQLNFESVEMESAINQLLEKLPNDQG